MGFLDRLRGKKQEKVEPASEQRAQEGPEEAGRRIKRYTSEGKPVSE